MKRVVITGMGVISPVGNGLDAYWQSLTGGVCGIGPITRFDPSDYKVRIAAEVKNFDALEYMSKDIQRKNDLFAQYALAAAKQAFAQSGLEGAIEPARLGVYMGSGIGGMETFARQHDVFSQRGPERVSPFFVPMLISNMGSGIVAIELNAQGPCLPVVTACATGTHSVGEAFLAVAMGRADAIIAGGSEAAVNPLSIAGFTNCMALTRRNDPHSASIPFDKRRDGFVMGEGAGALVLEEYEHAKARKATIYAELCGYGNSCDAYHVTAPQPEARGATAAIVQALEQADYRSDEKLYINAHGTSTPLNDKCETLAIKNALGSQAHSALVSSTKSMTGHMLGAAGAVEAIAATMALHTGTVPPTIGYQEPDPECDLDVVPNKARSAQCDMALSVSLGFGGHNGCLALRKAD